MVVDHPLMRMSYLYKFPMPSPPAPLPKGEGRNLHHSLTHRYPAVGAKSAEPPWTTQRTLTVGVQGDPFVNFKAGLNERGAQFGLRKSV